MIKLRMKKLNVIYVNVRCKNISGLDILKQRSIGTILKNALVMARDWGYELGRALA